VADAGAVQVGQCSGQLRAEGGHGIGVRLAAGQQRRRVGGGEGGRVDAGQDGGAATA
jgi:hypothetical protein